MRRLPFAVLSAATLLLAGCRSAFIDATVANHSTQPISLVEVDYPSASFGTQTLAPGQEYHYRFKVIGSGPVKLIYTDAANTEQHSTGPSLNESASGKLTVIVTPTGPQWVPQYTSH
ncbi:hypothetical protein FTO74_07940 [Granulicella sp. WH15]|uniref:hypothetical protein n=1 Tax=Granulicella sp. WH15 TaxID=2602070 RepID=UPI001366B556|nr:hypothetical protein [Granulicella sp. WH15]QHN03302.1 hypothetical protein FTO74_07940 [Granulicella sp. WH15]